MATRVKRVVDDGMVAHLWAHQAQDEARNARRNIFFFGDTIYSYGHHFPIAKHVSNAKHESAVLLTTRTYSHTTAGHVSAVSSACRHLTVYHVAHPTETNRREQFEEYRQRMVGLMQDYAKARQRKPIIFRELGGVVEEANSFAKFFGLRTRLKLPPKAEDMVAECERIAKAERDKKKREETKAAKAAAERLAQWLVGEYDGLYLPRSPVRLRIKDDELQTSLGATVPKADAIRCLKILRKLRKKSATYKRNGQSITLGPFTLDSMDESGTVQVGCHTVEWAEIERVAAMEGV